VVDPTGQFTYVTNGTTNNISAFAVSQVNHNEFGNLTAVSGSPFALRSGSTTPAAAVVHPSGKFLYTANYGSANVSAFSISTTGQLTELTGSPFAAGQQPKALTIAPNGKFLYVTNLLDNTISAYSISTTGALAELTALGSPFSNGSGTQPKSIATDPRGRYAFVANSGTNDVSAYTISMKGALAAVPGSPFAEPSGSLNPTSVTVDLSSRFVFVANVGSDDASQFAIGAGGVLSSIGANVAAGSGPVCITTTPVVPLPVVPEPTTLALMSMGVVGYALSRRRRR
jgi:6-phosphogluconolactonase (cycloisomerase 2 family)